MAAKVEVVFTFATNSEQWGASESQRGKYPVKLYNSSRVLIYQEDNGGGNGGLKPSDGVLHTSIAASSMSATVANPITFYGSWSAIINQDGQSGDLYNYYWASCSRGTDGKDYMPLWHNLYLDSYIPLRHKSIYDPCPYGYRVPSNGTYNEFNTNPGWTYYSLLGGTLFNQSWFGGLGWRQNVRMYHTGYEIYIWSSTCSSENSNYSAFYIANKVIHVNRSTRTSSDGLPLRCIEDCDLLPDQTHSSDNLNCKIPQKKVLYNY